MQSVKVRTNSKSFPSWWLTILLVTNTYRVRAPWPHLTGCDTYCGSICWFRRMSGVSLPAYECPGSAAVTDDRDSHQAVSEKRLWRLNLYLEEEDSHCVGRRYSFVQVCFFAPTVSLQSFTVLSVVMGGHIRYETDRCKDAMSWLPTPLFCCPFSCLPP